MPNRSTHVLVGGCGGALAATVRARHQQLTPKFLEILGGAVGGCVGARLPDLLEPARLPRHRKFVHSFGAGVGAVKLTFDLLEGWETYWRRVAAEAREQRPDPSLTTLERVVLFLKEALACILAGLLIGLAVGYLSHLLLDAFSPAGLPILGLA